MTGVDLTQIDGVDAYTALKVVSEIGGRHDEMDECEALCVLAGAEPKQPHHRWEGDQLQDQAQRQPCGGGALRLAANALHRSDSAMGAFLRRKKAQLGAPKAITATAHKLARLIYSMLRYGQEYLDAGAEYYERRYQQRGVARGKARGRRNWANQLLPMYDAQPSGLPHGPEAAAPVTVEVSP